MTKTFNLLLEIQHLRGIVLENRTDFLRQKYLPSLKTRIDYLETMAGESFNSQYDQLLGQLSLRFLPDDQKDPPLDFVVERTFEWLLKLDPTPTKKYSQWIITTFLHYGWAPEDGYKITDILTTFIRVGAHMPVEQRDINKYKTPNDLYKALRPYETAQSKREIARAFDDEMLGQAKVVYNDADYKIIEPLTHQAACHFGINTRWCTATKDSDYHFSGYKKIGPLYIILDKKHNRRWQFHFQTEQFMDEEDQPIDAETFANDHPKVIKAFDEIIKPVAWMKGNPVYKIDRVYGLENALAYEVKKKNVLGDTLYTINVTQAATGQKYLSYITPSPEKYVDAPAIVDVLNELELDAMNGTTIPQFIAWDKTRRVFVTKGFDR